MANNYTSVTHLFSKNQQTSAPTSKENEPFPAHNLEGQEEQEVFPSPEVSPYVKIKPNSVELPPDLKKLGLQTTPVSPPPAYQKIKLPLSDDKIVSGLHSPITSSLRWLATLAIYILARAHLGLKMVGGKAVRVIKR